MPTDKVLENFRRADFEEFWSYSSNATVVTAGSPGSITGPGTSTVLPANLAALKADPEIGTVGYTPRTAWTASQYIVIGDGSRVYWTGTDWATAVITGVTAGAPGAFTPARAELPANITALRADANVGTAAKTGNASWTTGQYVVLANGAEVHWDGTAWTTGRKPA